MPIYLTKLNFNKKGNYNSLIKKPGLFTKKNKPHLLCIYSKLYIFLSHF